ncbi:MAG: hypothetical protein U9P07_08400 [Pseudomonadota bacterium]|nr:hypothetical protein [Pseudomonadota bacterium]MEA3240110.1 hypothetical protein [Pseudomonadota bacterium]
MTETNLPPAIADRYLPFMREVMAADGKHIHSVHVSGSALTDDFNPKLADIHSVIVLHQMELDFLKLLAPLGKKYGKKGIAAPLIMTPYYISSSLDVFPIEFLDLKILHQTIHGEDLLKNLEIRMDDLRHQCERELKIRLIGLRQDYLSAAGNRKILADGFNHAFSRYLPLFRGVVMLLGSQPAINPTTVLDQLQKATTIDLSAFGSIFQAHGKRQNLSMDQLNTIFTNCYQALEQLGDLVDEHQN